MDSATGTDNAADYHRHASETTADYHPQHHDTVFSAAFTLTDPSQKTGAQQEELEKKSLKGDGPGLFERAPEEEAIVVKDREARFAWRLVLAWLTLGGLVAPATGYVCGSPECDDDQIFSEQPERCSDCGEPTMRPVATIIAEQERRHKQHVPAPEPLPATHQFHALPLQHSRQTVKQTETWMENLLKQAAGSDDAQGFVVLWLMLFGDVTTVEYCMKNVEKHGWHKRFVIFLGRLHEFIYMGKAIAELLLDFGGPELGGLAGWWSERQQLMVCA